MNEPDDDKGGVDTQDPPKRGREEMAIERDDEDATRRLQAREMLGPKGVVQIEHEGEVYTLRLTRNNRLILTK